MDKVLAEYYRIPISSVGSIVSENLTGGPGFFRFGSKAICYGKCNAGPIADTACADLYDASHDANLEPSEVHLPFDPAEVIDNLRKERYVARLSTQHGRWVRLASVRKAYYAVREFLPVSVRRHFQRAYFKGWRELSFPRWPVDVTVDALHEDLLRLSMKAKGVQRIPFIWFWPEGARNCLIMTHDVETAVGRDFTPQLMDLDDSFGIKSSFQVVPEKRYDLPDRYVKQIRDRGFEFNLHDLNHDGFLFREKGEFLRRVAKINEYVQKYAIRGFRSGAMYRNQAWYDSFELSYDMSVPSVAHLEPQQGGCCTVMPYFVGKILELPLTTTQDYTLFHVLNDYSLELWKKQLAIIRERYGLMSFITHPDYLIEHRARKVYEALLDHLGCMVTQENVWTALPGEVDRWWRARNQMQLVPVGSSWTIEGPGKDRARVAYAHLDNDRLSYEVPGVKWLERESQSYE